MTVTILTGDCRDLLRTLPDQSVQMVVTSPPYYGLRDYGTAAWDGGNPACDHRHENRHQNQGANSARVGRSNVDYQKNDYFKNQCAKCGALRVDRQIGLEDSPSAYVAKMVDVFAEVRRVLRDDGTLWLNLGDSYAGGGNRGGGSYAADRENWRTVSPTSGQRSAIKGLKPKDLIGIPWRVAFALQADGWYLRQDIVWSKPNPMPESVRDRCTKAHEYIFLLSKSERYHFDNKAIAEPMEKGSAGSEFHTGKTGEHQLGRASTKPRHLPGNKSHKGTTAYEEGDARHRTKEGLVKYAARVNDDPSLVETRNKRSVWTVATTPFPEAHFATFPAEIPEICIAAGSRPGDTILDPFAGAGTSGLVADRMGRNAILIELNPEYANMARRRISRDAPLFADVVQS